MRILDRYCSVDAFWQQFASRWEQEQLASGCRQLRRQRATRLRPSAIMTILILFQHSGHRTVKGLYTEYVQTQLRAETPRMLSYTRFVALIPRVLLPLAVCLQTQFGTCIGISCVDSTSLRVCHNARIGQHRVFAVDARRGKPAGGWFNGFKLHLVVNDRGELLAFWRSAIHCSCASWPSSRASTMNSKASARSRTRATAAPTISSFTASAD